MLFGRFSSRTEGDAQAKTQRLRTKCTYATLAATQQRLIETEVHSEIQRLLAVKSKKNMEMKEGSL
jgi:hypothetical protein